MAEGINVKVIDGGGKNPPLKLTREGAVNVAVQTHPPLEDDITALPFRQYFTDNGLSTGSNDMCVDGSTVNVPFYIRSQQDKVTFIKSISVEIADAGAKFNLFGALTALTNGVEFSFDYVGGSEIIHDGIQDNLEWYRLANRVPTIIDLSGGGADAVVVFIDLAVLFGNPFGVRLRKGSSDKLTFTVKDKLSTGITTFNIIGYGIQI